MLSRKSVSNRKSERERKKGKNKNQCEWKI